MNIDPVEFTSNTQIPEKRDKVEFIQSNTLDQNEQLGKKCTFTVTDRHLNNDMHLNYRNVQL